MLKEKYIGFIYIFGVILTSYSQINVATLGTHKIKLQVASDCILCKVYIVCLFLFFHHF